MEEQNDEDQQGNIQTCGTITAVHVPGLSADSQSDPLVLSSLQSGWGRERSLREGGPPRPEGQNSGVYRTFQRAAFEFSGGRSSLKWTDNAEVRVGTHAWILETRSLLEAADFGMPA